MRDNDKDEEKMKDYADNRTNAMEWDVAEGDKVLVKQQRVNKWTTAFKC